MHLGISKIDQVDIMCESIKEHKGFIIFDSSAITTDEDTSLRILCRKNNASYSVVKRADLSEALKKLNYIFPEGESRNAALIQFDNFIFANIFYTAITEKESIICGYLESEAIDFSVCEDNYLDEALTQKKEDNLKDWHKYAVSGTVSLKVKELDKDCQTVATIHKVKEISGIGLPAAVTAVRDGNNFYVSNKTIEETNSFEKAVNDNGYEVICVEFL